MANDLETAWLLNQDWICMDRWWELSEETRTIKAGNMVADVDNDLYTPDLYKIEIFWVTPDAQVMFVY